MSRQTLYVRLMLVLVVLASLAIALGNEPWGPR